MLTFADRGGEGGGVKNVQKNADVIYDSSLRARKSFLTSFLNFTIAQAFEAKITCFGFEFAEKRHIIYSGLR